jgi:ssDNA-binding Zn-finger/Zn-ribbon topoisomerase 1
LHKAVSDALVELALGLLRQPRCNDIPNMALEAVNPQPEERREEEVRPAVATCPVCEGRMEVVYARNNQQVSVCTDCHSGLTIPAGAWDVVRIKRESKWMPKP